MSVEKPKSTDPLTKESIAKMHTDAQTVVNNIFIDDLERASIGPQHLSLEPELTGRPEDNSSFVFGAVEKSIGDTKRIDTLITAATAASEQGGIYRIGEMVHNASGNTMTKLQTEVTNWTTLITLSFDDLEGFIPDETHDVQVIFSFDARVITMCNPDKTQEAHDTDYENGDGYDDGDPYDKDGMVWFGVEIVRRERPFDQPHILPALNESSTTPFESLSGTHIVDSNQYMVKHASSATGEFTTRFGGVEQSISNTFVVTYPMKTSGKTYNILQPILKAAYSRCDATHKDQVVGDVDPLPLIGSATLRYLVLKTPRE